MIFHFRSTINKATSLLNPLCFITNPILMSIFKNNGKNFEYFLSQIKTLKS